MAVEDEHNGRELTTWQEIGKYLGISDRTAQIWYKERGLPVRKLAGRVVASTDDLDRWKREQMSSPTRVEPAPTMAPEEIPPIPPSPSPAPDPHPARAFLTSKPVVITAIAFVAATLGLSFYWFTPRLGEPSNYMLEGRLLTVLDEHNRRLWEYVFPETFPPTRASGPQLPHKFLDLQGNGHKGFIVSAYPLLYCFNHSGHVVWKYRPGREVTSGQGRRVPAEYNISMLDALSRPRSDGGRIIVGAYRGPGALFVVELLTKDGKKVAEYFHFGWFFGLATGVLDENNHEDIFLAGVDNVSGASSDFSATLVVLNPDRFDGQATTFAADPRALKDVPTAQEKAVLLIKEFAPNPEPINYCRGKDISIFKGYLELIVTQGQGQPFAHFRFDRRLQILSVAPELNLLNILRSTILKDVPPPRWQEVIQQSLGDIRYIRNEFK